MSSSFANHYNSFIENFKKIKSLFNKLDSATSSLIAISSPNEIRGIIEDTVQTLHDAHSVIDAISSFVANIERAIKKERDTKESDVEVKGEPDEDMATTDAMNRLSMDHVSICSVMIEKEARYKHALMGAVTRSLKFLNHTPPMRDLTHTPITADFSPSPISPDVSSASITSDHTPSSITDDVSSTPNPTLPSHLAPIPGNPPPTRDAHPPMELSTPLGTYCGGSLCPTPSPTGTASSDVPTGTPRARSSRTSWTPDDPNGNASSPAPAGNDHPPKVPSMFLGMYCTKYTDSGGSLCPAPSLTGTEPGRSPQHYGQPPSPISSDHPPSYKASPHARRSFHNHYSLCRGWFPYDHTRLVVGRA